MLRTNAKELEVGLTGTASPRFGHDFSRAPVHPPAPGAIQSKLAINAYAYTVANHVVFGAGRYAPERPDGKRLLAHELDLRDAAERVECAAHTGPERRHPVLAPGAHVCPARSG